MHYVPELEAEANIRMWRDKYGQVHESASWWFANCRSGEIIKEDTPPNINEAIQDMRDTMAGKTKWSVPHKDPPGLLVITEMPRPAKRYVAKRKTVIAQQQTVDFVVKRKCRYSYGFAGDYVIEGKRGGFFRCPKSFFESTYFPEVTPKREKNREVSSGRI